LLHRLEWGSEKKRNALEQWKAAKSEYPAAFLEKPGLYPWLKWYLETWDELGRSRKTDQGYPRPIHVEAILDYCELFHLDWPEVREELFYFCGVLDGIYCEWSGKKDEEKEQYIREERDKLKESDTV
jgi:hypothetical protein